MCVSWRSGRRSLRWECARTDDLSEKGAQLLDTLGVAKELGCDNHFIQESAWQANVDGEWLPFEPTGDNKYLIAHCHVREEPLTDELVAKLPADSVFKDLYKVVLMEDPNAGGADCICHSGTAPAVVTLLFLFSVCVQAAEGLSFGIVPYISRPALGVVSGMVGAGGNSGAVAMLNLFFKGPRELPLPHLDTFGMY